MEQEQKDILEKLIHNHCIGKKHLKETTILKGFNRKDHGKLKQAIKQLVRQGYIVKHPTSHEDGYTIPSHEVAEVKALLKLR